MIELFSCRNCIHNAGQSLRVGRGAGLCLKHTRDDACAIIEEPSDTTCKYHHRKDLPHFVIDEGRSEHAAEFAGFTALVSLSEMKPVPRRYYSERYTWENHTFDALNSTLSTYYKAGKSWVFVQSFAGGVDGRRALAFGSLSRRYLDHCGTWESSYRMAMRIAEELASPRYFSPTDLVVEGGDEAEATLEARWDVFFAQLSGLQEYGWHAGLERLMWASDAVNGALSNLDWGNLQVELPKASAVWIETIVDHATENGAFFTKAPHEVEDIP